MDLNTFRNFRLSLSFALLTAAAVIFVAPVTPAQNGASGMKTQAFQVLKSVSGSVGADQGGHYVIADPRTTFHVPGDKQVVVYFEWQGPPGPHKFVGTWRNPEGKAVVISDFEYVASANQFAGHWTLTLPESIATGLWALEAQIDGQPAGTHTIQILPGESAASPVEPIPSPTDIYKRAVSSVVEIESLDSGGELLHRASGFFVAPGRLLTIFHVIDGASSVRVKSAGGANISTGEAYVWNRWQDWVVLAVDGVSAPVLDRAKPSSGNVGDTCYALLRDTQGTETVGTVQITGRQSQERVGVRISISEQIAGRATGTPLLDIFGRVVGVVGGSLLPGVDSVHRDSDTSGILTMSYGQSTVTQAVPINLIPDGATLEHRASFAEIASSGQFVTPILSTSKVMNGYLAKDYAAAAGGYVPKDITTEFSKRDPSLAVIVDWSAFDKMKGVELIRFFDVENKQIGESKPKKISIGAHDIAHSGWKVPLTNFVPGVYRVDLMLNDQPVWRAFFRVHE